MTGSTPARARLRFIVPALACLLLGCGTAEDGPDRPAAPSEGRAEDPGGRETPCPESSAPGEPSDGGSPEEQSSEAPGDSRSYSLPPGDDCVIESGTPSMPVDP